MGGKSSWEKMSFYGSITPKHLDAVAFISRELFGINSLSKHSILIWSSAQQSAPIRLPQADRALVHLPIPSQSADSGGSMLGCTYRGIKIRSSCLSVLKWVNYIKWGLHWHNLNQVNVGTNEWLVWRAFIRVNACANYNIVVTSSHVATVCLFSDSLFVPPPTTPNRLDTMNTVIANCLLITVMLVL